jgi:predicted nucleic acid-binding protein
VILVDTSAWIEFFRGKGALRTAVDAALEDGEAVLCGPIVTELRRGLRSSQRTHILALLEGCQVLSEPEDLWIAAGDLGSALARRGSTAKTLDLLIATYAIAHVVPLLTADSDFRAIARLNVGLSLVV